MRRVIKILTSIFIIFLFIGCCKKTTQVILLPEPDGHIGVVDISNENGTERIDKAYQSSKVELNSKPDKPKVLPKSEVNKILKDALSVKPNEPKKYMVFFGSGETKLNQKAKETLEHTVKYISNIKQHYDIELIGHADRKGTNKSNKKVSLKRVDSVKKYLLDENIKGKYIFTSYHGEENPLVKTADNVSEPKNRRVEIIVR